MSNARFSIIPAWVVTHPRMKGSDLKVLCLLGTYTNKEGWCRRSQVKMAEQLGCGRSTVQDSLNRLSDIGAVEKRRVDSPDGRDSAHWYRVVLDRATASDAFFAYDEDDEKEFGPIVSAENGGTPAGIPAPPAGHGAAPPAGSGPAPINESSLTENSNGKEREARERDHSGSVINADLIKRVQKFCTGDGYREGEWPKWATSTIAHIAKQFAQLAPDEQRAACEWRDAFLAKCKRDRVTKPMPVANYFRDKVWEMLSDTDKSAVRPVAGGAPVVSGGKVAVPVFGPAFAAARAWALVQGPVDFELPDDLREKVRAAYEVYARASSTSAFNYRQKLGLLIDDAGELEFPPDFEAREWERRKIDEGYPEAVRLNEAAKHRSHVTVEPIFERLKDLCEAVPIGSAMWDRWRAYHEERGWPFVPIPSGMRVVFFPKGGPEGLLAFERAADEAMCMERGDDYAIQER